MFSGLTEHRPDILVTDYSFGGNDDGLRMVARIRRLCPEIKIVVFSRIRQIATVREVLVQGADAFVSKAVELDFVVKACQAVLENNRYVDPITEKQLQEFANRGEDIDVQSVRSAEDSLSPREREVLRLLAGGLSIRDIAQRFNRSPKTISVQKCAAMSKLGLTKEIELAMYLAMSQST
jgi:two-component system capsular synthesis response regulator RcsB